MSDIRNIKEHCLSTCLSLSIKNKMEEKKQRPVSTAKCCHCNTQMKFYLPEKPGNVQLTCTNPQCGKKFVVKITQTIINVAYNTEQPKDNQQCAQSIKTEPIYVAGQNDNTAQMAHLKQSRGLFRSDIMHRLHIGENTIGRKDDATTSDIMLEGDNTISRRSISITVTERENGYEYLFTLLAKPKNPVCVDGKEYTEPPVSFVIYPGAEIVLGKTHLTLTI